MPFVSSALSTVSPSGVQTLLQYAGDAFGRLRVSESVVEADAKFTSDLIPLRFGTAVVSGGTVTQMGADDPRARLRVLAAGDSAALQSYEHYRYVSAQSMLINMTPLFGAPIANLEKRAGFYSDRNGVYLAQTGSGLVFRIRSSVSGSVVDTSYPQASWADPMDGTGPSGIMLDPTKTFVCTIDYQFLGHGEVRLGFRIGDVLIYALRVPHSNVDTLPYMRSGSNPLRFEIVTLQGYVGGDQSLYVTCASVVREGATEDAQACVDNGLTPVATGAVGAAGEVFALLRVTPGNFEAILRVLDYEVANTGNQLIRARLILGGTLGGAAPVWSAGVPGGTGQISLTRGITITGGVQIQANYISAGTSASRPGNGSASIEQSLPVGWNLDGTPQTIALVLHSSGASAALFAIRWEIIR